MDDTFAVKDEDGTVEFTVRLDKLRELLEAPEPDPFMDQVRVIAGIEQMASYLYTRRLRKLPSAAATLLLPSAEVAPAAAATATAAVQRFCDVRIAEAQRTIAINKFDGRTKLPVGLAAAVAMVVLLFILIWLLPQDLEPLAAILGPVVTIASWAAIWNPVETLLYENWEERRTIQVFTCLRQITITVAPAR